jgi:DNA-directed RNA polymerase subunit N (RpoN/RPB10)
MFTASSSSKAVAPEVLARLGAFMTSVAAGKAEPEKLKDVLAEAARPLVETAGERDIGRALILKREAEGRPESELVWQHKLPAGVDYLWDMRCVTCLKPLAKYQSRFEALLTNGWVPAQVLDYYGITAPCCRTSILTPKLFSAPYNAHPGLISGTYQIEDFDRPDFRPKPSRRNMLVVKGTPAPAKGKEKKVELQWASAGSSVRSIIPEDYLGEAGGGVGKGGKAITKISSGPELIRRDPISGLSLEGGRRIVGWVDPGEGYRIPVLQVSYVAR